MKWLTQEQFNIRFEWGLEGAIHLSPYVDVAVVVDVLSFSTCVDIATSRGALVYPCLYKDNRAIELAKSQNASLASIERSLHGLSLSPTSMMNLNSHDKIVLPSPNGSAISFSVKNTILLCGCLRNAKAIATKAQELGQNILVIAAGEKWSDGSLRPALEDQIGAGAILSHLKGTTSPEANAAIWIFEKAKSNLQDVLIECSSGKELIHKKFLEDIKLASEYNVSQIVPILKNNLYFQDINLV